MAPLVFASMVAESGGKMPELEERNDLLSNY
jgi:hypothetical protein